MHAMQLITSALEPFFPRNSNGSLSHHPLAPPLCPYSTMDDDEEPDDLIPCDCIGAPIFVENGRSFYAAYHTCDLRVKIGDCARISIEGSNEAYGFGQVLAIFADDNEEVFIEVRWFKEVRELLPRNRKMCVPCPLHCPHAACICQLTP